MEKKKMTKRQSITLGYIIIFASIIMFSYNYLATKKDNAFKEMNLRLYNMQNEVEELDENSTPTDDDPGISLATEEDKKEEQTDYSNYYIGTLSIPKINFQRGFVDPSSPDNTITKNLQIVEPSDMPDVAKGNFIIAAHSGTGYLAFFKDLYLLNKGDYAYVTFNGVKYTYRITNIYLQAKTGQIAIYRDYEKTTLTLVTCTKNDKKNQTIYIAELINKE